MLNSVNNYNSRNISFKGYADKIVAKMPTVTISSKRAKQALLWINRNIRSYDQRLLLGLTALLTQPFIDLSNHKIDKDTRAISALRTTAKIIVGTTVGVLVRWSSIKLATKHPAFRIPNINPETIQFKRYTNAMGTLLAVGIALFTNFLVDAPLTKLLTTFLCDNYKKRTKNGSEKC